MMPRTKRDVNLSDAVRRKRTTGKGCVFGGHPLLFSVLCLLTLSFSPLLSQSLTPLMIGLLGEASRGLITGTASIYAGSPDCGLFTSGSGSSVRFGSMIWVPSLLSSKFGLALRPEWNSSLLTFSIQPDQAPWVFDPSVAEATEIEREFRLEVSSQSVGLTLMGTYQINERIALGFGPEVGYRIVQKATQTDHILGPGDISFQDGQTTRTMVEGPGYNINPLSLGLILSGFGTVPIGPRLSFLIEANTRADLLSPVRENQWRNFSFGGSLGLVFYLKGRAVSESSAPDTSLADLVVPVPDIPDTAIPIPPAPVPLLSAAIEVYGVEGDQRRDTVVAHFRERDRCRTLRFVPEVLFEKGSAELPQVYKRTEERPDSLPTLESLGFLDPPALQERLLDLIGLRLGHNAGSTIMLHPADRNAALAKERAGRVRDYLVRVWKIAPDRIEIAEGPGDLSEEEIPAEDVWREGVVIGSASSGIVVPVVSRRLDRDFDAPLVKVTTSHQADAGLRAWDMILASDDETIARYSSALPKGEGAGGMNWNMIYEGKGSDSSTITAQFTVEDSTGARKTARTVAPLMLVRSRIEVDRSVDLPTMTETILYRLPSSFHGAQSSPEYEDILHDVGENIRAGGQVSIVETGSSGADPLHVSSFRTKLDGLLKERKVAESQQSTPEEIIASLRQPGDCTNPDELVNATFLLLIRQPIR